MLRCNWIASLSIKQLSTYDRPGLLEGLPQDPFLFYLCMYMWCGCMCVFSIHACKWRGACVCKYTCVHLKVEEGSWLQGHPQCFSYGGAICLLRQRLSLLPEFTNSVSLPSQLAVKIFCMCLLSAGIIGRCHANLTFPLAVGDLNFSLNICKVNILSTESYLHVLSLF